MSIFKACDIRGVYGEELTVQHATALGYALAIRASSKEILVGGDGRVSTPALKNALMRALCESGKRVIDLGNVPTPAFYLARRKRGAPAGVMVTASHNPAADNGFKIVLGDLPITETELDEIRLLMESRAHNASERTGEIVRVSTIDEYTADVKTICSERGNLKIVIDAANGMLGPVAPRVFRELGYSVIELFTDIDGRFPNHPPNPAIIANLNTLRATVRNSRAALGIAYDGDGDRVAFVDERGDPVENDRVVVLFAREALAQHPGAAIIYDQKCSDVVREEIVRAGGIPHIEKSGYTFIKTALLRQGAAYGGELSGHHFFGEIGGDDALVASLKMAALVQQSQQSLAEWVGAMPRYPITPDIRLRVARGEAEAIIGAIKQHVRGAIEISEMDGVRVRFPDGWGIARTSVTEAVVTLRFEGRTEQALERIKRAFVQAAPQLSGRI